MHTESTLALLKTLQDQICAALEQEDGEAEFMHEAWTGKLGIGEAHALKSGAVFEQTGVSFSHMRSGKMPASATARRPELAGTAFEAMGVSLVIHPKNLYVPANRASVCFPIAYPENAEPVWWSGGGFDLTPFYPSEEDIVHWHTVTRDICTPSGESVYPEFKQWCDKYFYSKHRNETRGAGGLFFDDLNRWDFNTCLNFIKAAGESYIAVYLPIMAKHKNTPYGERECDFQLYRRGRYVEFNLVWGRGTLFDLQGGGRMESTLISMPPSIRFEYQYTSEEGSPEARLNQFLVPHNWLREASR